MVKYMGAIQEEGESCNAWKNFRDPTYQKDTLFPDVSPATGMTYKDDEKKKFIKDRVYDPEADNCEKGTRCVWYLKQEKNEYNIVTANTKFT